MNKRLLKFSYLNEEFILKQKDQQHNKVYKNSTLLPPSLSLSLLLLYPPCSSSKIISLKITSEHFSESRIEVVDEGAGLRCGGGEGVVVLPRFTHKELC